MSDISWHRYPLITHSALAKKWLQIQSNLGLAPNTVEAYGRALEDFYSFCRQIAIEPKLAKREHIAAYIRDLMTRPQSRSSRAGILDSSSGLSNATIQQRLTAVRLFYDFLMEEGLREQNPVGRGRYTPGKGFGGQRGHGLVPRLQKMPWIPNDAEWKRILEASRTESLRNRLMLALSYDAALRREELCNLQTGDIDPSNRLLHLRAENTKSRQGRVVPYSVLTDDLYRAYLEHRRNLSRSRGPLFLSESRRNFGQPISIWTWSKVIRGISTRSELDQFSTHTPRHLCLTDLARANWDIHEIATFAGHRSIQTTLLYIHLSGRELALKLEQGMAAIHSWRIKQLSEVLL